MKENLKQTNIGNIAKNVAATTIIGAGLLFGGRFLITELRAKNNDNCANLTSELTAKSCLTLPPEPGQPDTKVRSFNNSYIEMDETLKWNSEISRWQIIDREWEAVPQRESLLPIIDKINADQVNSELIQRQKFFETPASTSETGCKTGVWDNSNVSYTYCWDQKSNSWQQTGMGPIYNVYYR